MRGTFAAPHGVRIAFGKQTTCRSFNYECWYKISLEVQIILSKPGFDKLFLHRRELLSTIIDQSVHSVLKKLLRDGCKLQLKINHTVMQPNCSVSTAEVEPHIPVGGGATAADDDSMKQLVPAPPLPMGECFVCADPLVCPLTSSTFCIEDEAMVVCSACSALAELDRIPPNDAAPTRPAAVAREPSNERSYMRQSSPVAP